MGLGLQGAYGVKAFTDTLEEIVAKREAQRLMAEATAQKNAQQQIENKQRDRQLTAQEEATREATADRRSRELDSRNTAEGMAFDRDRADAGFDADVTGLVNAQRKDNPIAQRSVLALRKVTQPDSVKIQTDKPNYLPGTTQYRTAPRPETSTPESTQPKENLLVDGKEKGALIYHPRGEFYTFASGPQKGQQVDGIISQKLNPGVQEVMVVGPEGPGVGNKGARTFTPLINTATNQPVGKSMPAGLSEKLAEAESGIAIVAELKNLKKDEWLGPAQGRFTQAKMATPDSITSLFGAEPTSPELAAFAARTARLKNAVIEAITGAAVGVQEAQRIMGEVPDFTDKPVQWQEKADLTARNLKYLHDVMMQRSGAPQNMRQPSQPPSATPTTKMPPVSERVVGQTKWTFTSGPNSGKTGTWDGSAWVVK